MEKKSKTGAVIGTIVAVLLCGCPGLCLCLFGLLFAIGGGTYNSTFGNYVDSGTMPSWTGYVFMCASIILIIIPIVVGFVTLRNKKPKENLNFNEPLPPAS
jgi:TRAP-type C4-dicarboxylate transport system permease small subunit